MLRSKKLISWLLVAIALAANSAFAGIGLEQRLGLLSERIANSPTNPELYLRRALIYSDTGDFKLALADVNTAAQFGPVENTHFVRGILLYRLGQFEQATTLFSQFIEKNPSNHKALLYRARVLRDSGELQKALLDYQRVISLFPDTQPGNYLTAARLIVELADNGAAGYRHDQAIALLDKRREQLGHAPQLQRAAIAIEQQRCQSNAVLKRLQSLHPNSKKSPDWLLQVAEQQLLTGDTDTATSSLTGAKQQLQQRRPTKARAELQRRADFLAALLATEPRSSDSLKESYQRFYPAPKLEPAEPQGHSHQHSHSSDQGSHSHSVAENDHHGDKRGHSDRHSHSHKGDVLEGFERPQQRVDGLKIPYDPQWADAVQPFYRCLFANSAGQSDQASPTL